MRRLAFSWLVLTALVATACGPDRRPRDEDDDDSQVTTDAGGEDHDGGGHDAGDPRDAGDAHDAGDAGEPRDGGHEDGGGGQDGGGGEDGGGPVNRVPSASVVTPASGRGDIALDYLLFDSDRDLLSIDVRWSRDGATWTPATGEFGAQTTGLASSPDGTAHQWVWDSARDLPEQTATVRLRLTPRDPQANGTPAQTGAFTVDNRIPNDPPVVSFATFTTPVRGDLNFTINFSDPQGDEVTAVIEWRLGSGGWSPITLASPSPLRWRASPNGTAVGLAWSSASDIPSNETQVQLRAIVNDGRVSSAAAESARFDVNNAIVPPPNGVRISEVFAGSPDWIEIVNLGSGPSIDLRGWKVKWWNAGESGVATLASPSSSTGYLLGSGQRAIVTEESGTNNNTGTIYLSTSSSTQNLGWASAQPGAVALIDTRGTADETDDAIVDFVRWGGSTVVAHANVRWTESRVLHVPHDDATLSRRTGSDTDSAADFCATAPTRLATNAACIAAAPAGLQVRVNEIHSGNGGPFVELFNAGSITVDLRGWVIASESSEAYATYALRPVTLAARSRLVVRAASGTDSTGVQYTNDADALALAAGSSGTVSLREPTGEPLDFVAFGSVAAIVPPPLTWASTPALPRPGLTSSLARVPDGSTSIAPTAWCLADPSPGAANASCRQAPISAGIRISEIADGAIGIFIDRTPAGIELQNTSSNTVSLADWSLRWIPGGMTSSEGLVLGDITLGPGERVWFAECDNPLSPAPGCTPFPWGILGTDQGGALELLDFTGKSVDYVIWGALGDSPSATVAWSGSPVRPAGGIVIPEKQSIGRREGASDTNRASDWCVMPRSQGTANAACTP